MTNETMKNIIERMTYALLEKHYYLTADEVIDLFEQYCHSSEDLEEILDIVANSELYNYINLEDGQSFVFSKDDAYDIQELFHDIRISECDKVWNKYVTYRGVSITLSELFDEVMSND